MNKIICSNITSFFLFVQISFSQEISGKWYKVDRAGLSEITYNDKNIIFQKLYIDFSPKKSKADTVNYEDILRFNDKIFVVRKDKNIDSGILSKQKYIDKWNGKFSAMTYFNFIDRKHFKMTWNNLDTSLSNKDSLLEMSKNDHRELFGWYCFSELYIDTLRNLKSVEKMTKADFIKFAKLYTSKFDPAFKEFEKCCNFGYIASYYNFELIVESLFETGINPITTAEDFDIVFGKYHNDPEIKLILDSTKH